MLALLQRVRRASVEVDAECIARIGPGLLIFVGVEKGDSQPVAKRMLERIAGYRIFADDQGRMNLSIRAIGGALLLVPQFTLAADTRKGTRPSFSRASEAGESARLFAYLTQCARSIELEVQVGRFGADMQVHLVNDGPVTFLLEVKP